VIQGINSTEGGYHKPWVSLDSAQRKLVENAGNGVEPIAPKPPEVVRVLQITDCHLGEHVGEKLAGMDTDASLDYVLEHIDSEQQRASRKAELLVATGDLANHGNTEAYKRLQGKLKNLSIPSAWLPGNHDDIHKMLQVVDELQLPGVVFVGNWVIIMLDSTIPDRVEGEIGRVELDRLTAVLSRLPQTCHIMICVHHQVLPVGSKWLDQQQIADYEPLIKILADEKRLRLVVSGHVHQDSTLRHPDSPEVEFITSPSTCIQFAPATRDFKIDSQLPGYRWFDLHADGSFQTGISRVENADLSMDLASSGY